MMKKKGWFGRWKRNDRGNPGKRGGSKSQNRLLQSFEDYLDERDLLPQKTQDWESGDDEDEDDNNDQITGESNDKDEDDSEEPEDT